MERIDGFGLGVTIIALQSFPMGFALSQFADDVLPLEIEEVEPVGFDMLYDGSLFAFDKAAPIKVAVSVIPGTSDDINLKILLASRKAASSIIPLPDVTSMVITYGDGGRVLLSNGTILRGPLGDTITTGGRKKGNQYTFVFGSYNGAQSAKQVVAGIAQAAISLLG